MEGRYARRIVVDRRRLLSLVAALGFAVVLLTAAPVRASGEDLAQQDPSTTVAFGGEDAGSTASTVEPTATDGTSDDEPVTDQTVVESPTSDLRLATENRRMLAIIGSRRPGKASSTAAINMSPATPPTGSRCMCNRLPAFVISSISVYALLFAALGLSPSHPIGCVLSPPRAAQRPMSRHRLKRTLPRCQHQA